MHAMLGTVWLPVLAAPVAAADGPAFSLPLDCAGKTRCLMQNYVDMDPGVGKLDPLCGAATYDGHKGTDIRVATIAEMAAGIPILAMADGMVTAVRDGEDEAVIATQEQRQAIKGRECGNGLVVDHGLIGGKRWTTQYCHMRQGSLALRKGQPLKRGDRLGQMGLSGMTQFPHIHVTLRADNIIIDPFTALPVGQKPVCDAGGVTPVFDQEALAELAADDSPMLASGFSTGPLSSKELMTGTVQLPRPGTQLVYYAWLKNLKAGDQVKLTVRAGSTLYTETTSEPLASSKADYVIFAGKKSGGKNGVIYSGSAQMLRMGTAVFTSEAVELPV